MMKNMKRAPMGVLAAAIVLAGCADFKGIEPHSTMRTGESVGLVANAPAFVPAAEWWREFGDEKLDALIAQALQGNPNLKLAQARLAKAQSATEGARSGLLPQLNGQLDSQRQQFSANNIYPPPIGGSI